MTARDDSNFRVESVWNAAADTYTERALSFRDYFGMRIVERLDLLQGAHVLDVPCGAGAVALPAAAAVGPTGRVIAVDAADRLLQLAARRAARAGAYNIEWHAGDLSGLPFGDESFDAVVCGFGVFYASNMTSATRRLWRLVKPGGTLLIATWAERLFEPANTAFWDAVRKVRPSLFHAYQPWESVDRPEALADLLGAAGVPHGTIVEEPYEQPLVGPDDWWHIVLGSHYRGVVDQLAPLERDLVEVLTLRPLSETAVDWVNVGALFAIARK